MKKLILVVALALGGCAGWTQQETETAGRVVRCAQSCVQACIKEFTTAPVCPAPQPK